MALDLPPEAMPKVLVLHYNAPMWTAEVPGGLEFQVHLLPPGSLPPEGLVRLRDAFPRTLIVLPFVGDLPRAFEDVRSGDFALDPRKALIVLGGGSV